MKLKNSFRAVVFALTIATLLIASSVNVYASDFKAQKTSVKKSIKATGAYVNWDGVTNVSQFSDENGDFCFTYNKGNYINVVKGNRTIKLKKKGTIFGAVTCDAKGYYYVVTGTKNTSNNTTKNTIFISKYDKSGKLLKSIGDNGSSSLADYYSGSFYTKIPFDAGNCDVAVNGDYLAVNYAREMYSGHQSNSLLLINTNTMEKIHIDDYYNSHSFAQRVIPYKDNFLMASEGDCYDRAFTVSTTDIANGTCSSQNIFDFWVKKGSLNAWDMSALNNNFAHLGGIAADNDNNAALVATSAKSLNKNAPKENEQLFIQIFDPTMDLDNASGYVTTGNRSGLSGPNGDKPVTNYGVKWLTNYSRKYTICNPQVVSTSNGDYVILFERYKKGKYQGIYYTIVDCFGNTSVKITKLSATAFLNPSEMPVYTNGKIYWAGNNKKNKHKNIYIYSFAVK